VNLTAAISPCPNDVFIFAGLINREVRSEGLEFVFDYQELETLNRGAIEGRWDVAKISYANHISCAKEYRLLRCGGALGRGCGPLLLSNREARGEESSCNASGARGAAGHGGSGKSGDGSWDPDAEILVPGKRTTANFLLDFYAGNGTAAESVAGSMAGPHEGAQGGSPTLRKTFLPFDELYRRLLGPEPCQGVVIHEMRFTYAADGLRLVQDLGAYWEARTGFPIPLGAVAFRERIEAQRPGTAAAVEAAIRASLAWSYAHPEAALELCRKHSQSMADTVLKSHIDLYVNAFSLDIGAEGEAAVEFFLSRQRLAEAHSGSETQSGF